MSRKLAILILTLFISVAVFGVETARKTLLRDSFVLTGIDGKPTRTDSNNVWLFEFDSDASDGKAVVKAGASLELLPSAALEKMLADVNERSAATYRLWGRVTKYKGKNFIFPTYFLPLSKAEPAQPTKSQESRQKNDLIISEPNDALTIPKEIIEKLKPRRIVRMAQLRKGLELKQDFILADRVGFIERSEGEVRFVPDGLGRRIEGISFGLLKCQELERVEAKQSAELERTRFKVAGIVTKYKGKNYLLLQKATPVYNHGNFNN